MKELENIIKYSTNLKLLYVEDNQNAREATLMIFEEFFQHIIVAVDGEDALEKFDDSFDLVITDINMPKLNGLAMTKKIRNLNENIPILVLSAYNESGYFLESIKLNVDGYLLKPIDMDQFLTALNKIISKVKLSEESKNYLNLLQQYQEVTDKSSVVIKTNLERKITYVNNLFCEISEYKREELIGQNHNIISHPSNSPKTYEKIWNTIQVKKLIWQGIVRNVTKSGKSFYLQSSVKPILDLNNNIIEYVFLENNVTKLMNQEDQLLDFIEVVGCVAVVLIDIEQFNDIKKYYGLNLSNKIKLEFTKRFYEFVPDGFSFDKIFILDNGKVALVKKKFEKNTLKEELKNNLLRLKNNIDEAEFIIEGVGYEISIIISVACKDNPYENATLGIKELIDKKQDFIISNDLVEKERELAQHNLKTLKMIKFAIDSDNIIVYFQAIVDNNTKEIIKYEALVRLVNEDKKVLTPNHFLDVAKKGKYYSQVTSVVINQTFKNLKVTNKELTINLSAIDIEKKATQKEIFSLLEKYKNDAHRITFELLEDEEIKDFQTIRDFIANVKEYGVRIAIDDFGTGHSNFERLLSYKPDILKIDGGLIKNIHTDKYSLSVVKTIVDFARKQNIKTVGEFVENEEIYIILKEIGVDYSQGYYFDKPKLLIN
ncbi:MAG: EAL domain-containing protein [Colwellia sp.]